MKTTNPLARLFGTSPFGPIQEHMRTVDACVDVLPPLVDAYVAGDMDAVSRHRDRIFELEGKADDLKNSVRAALPSTLLLPVARRDLLDLLSSQDAIADAAQDAAGLLGLGRLRTFPALEEPLVTFARDVRAVAGRARALIDQLDELLEMGFRGKEAERLLEVIDEVARLESATDRQGTHLVRLLFDHEEEIGPLSVVFWHEFLRHLGHVADEAENVGDRLRLLIAR